jgi:hypothetical protein
MCGISPPYTEKQEKTFCGFLLQKNKYDFLRRHYPHQVKGSKVHPSSQPVNTSSPVFQLSKQKPETPVLMPPVEKLRTMTSYGGITRIRLKGRSWMTSSQPADTSSPVFICKCIIYLLMNNCKPFAHDWSGNIVGISGFTNRIT